MTHPLDVHSIDQILDFAEQKPGKFINCTFGNGNSFLYVQRNDDGFLCQIVPKNEFHRTVKGLTRQEAAAAVPNIKYRLANCRAEDFATKNTEQGVVSLGASSSRDFTP